MKASELRIGNLVGVNGNGAYMVSSLGEIKGSGIAIYRQHKDEKLPEGWKATPIPITEEWLLKFGLKKHDFKHNDGDVSKGYRLNTKFIQRGINAPFVICNIYSNNELGFVANIEYVHQLQNLYFALTGEELKTQS